MLYRAFTDVSKSSDQRRGTLNFKHHSWYVGDMSCAKFQKRLESSSRFVSQSNLNLLNYDNKLYLETTRLVSVKFISSRRLQCVRKEFCHPINCFTQAHSNTSPQLKETLQVGGVGVVDMNQKLLRPKSYFAKYKFVRRAMTSLWVTLCVSKVLTTTYQLMRMTRWTTIPGLY